MRIAIQCYRGAASASRAVAVKKASAEVAARHEKRSALGEIRGGIAKDVGTVAGGAGKVSQRVFAGSSDTRSYAPTSPLLRQVLQPDPPEPQPCPTPTATVYSPPQAHAIIALSLAELKELPAADLQRMLAQRGVGRSTATEKDELAKWVHQHQGLPVVRPDATHPQPQTQKSLEELRKMSVAELQDMLAERGVPEGSATEKGELARWVWQHQDLPAIYSPKERRRQRRRSFGIGGQGEPYDGPYEEEKKPEQEKLEAPDEAKLLEGEEAKLLEGATQETTSTASRSVLWALGGIMASFALVVVFVASNDARRVAQEQPKSSGGAIPESEGTQ